MGKAIVITGVPGTGKSSIAFKLSKVLGGIYVNLSSFAIGSCLINYYEDLRDTYVIDEDELSKRLRNLIAYSRSITVVDTHYAEIIDRELISKVFILRLNPSILYRRLLKRRLWSSRKIAENLLAEVDGACSYSVREAFGDWEEICEIDVSGRGVDEVIHEIISILKGVKRCRAKAIDWLERGVPDEILNFIVKHC